jgi:hypothetical protein
MKTIKFSHRYRKMPRDFQKSLLLEVLPIKLEDLSYHFLHYDTLYSDYQMEDCNYPLPPKGDYMILLLQSGEGNGQLWTTIRSQWGKIGNKLEYYRGLIGEVLKCEISQ